MTNLVKCALAVFVVCSVARPSSSKPDEPTTESPSRPDSRAGRKFYEAEIYTGNYHDTVPFGEPDIQGLPRSVTAQKHVIPYRHAGSGIVKKNGNNWNVWKGENDMSEDADDSDNNDSPGRWQPPSPPQNWNNDAWITDPMYIMMLKNAMADYNKGESKPSGFLAKITADPALLLIAASIPISLLLAAVLPALTNMMMNGSSLPTITTTATGSQTRSTQADIMPYLSPVMEAIGSFGIRSIGSPDCMQRIFCQVAEEKMASYDSKNFRKAARIARYLSAGSWLENLGVKDIVDALSNGSCESVPCSSSKKEKVKSKHSQKLHSNAVRK